MATEPSHFIYAPFSTKGTLLKSKVRIEAIQAKSSHQLCITRMHTDALQKEKWYPAQRISFRSQKRLYKFYRKLAKTLSILWNLILSFILDRNHDTLLDTKNIQNQCVQSFSNWRLQHKKTSHFICSNMVNKSQKRNSVTYGRTIIILNNEVPCTDYHHFRNKWDCHSHQQMLLCWHQTEISKEK